MGLRRRGKRRKHREKDSAPGAKRIDPGFDLGAKEIAGTVVPEHDAGGVKFGGQGELGGDSMAGLRLCHTSRHGPGHLNTRIGADADNEIKPFFETRFEEKRNLDHPVGARIRRHPASPEGSHPRVNDSLPPQTLRLIGEDALGHPCTIQLRKVRSGRLRRGQEHGIPPPLPCRRHDFGRGQNLLFHDSVRVLDTEPQIREIRRGRGFTASDTTC